MFVKKEVKAVLLIALLCFTFSMTSSATMSDTHFLSNAEESRVVGGSECDDLVDGFTIGMTVATVLGCFWCPAFGIGAKVTQLFFC